jgi:hypothetical protein
MPEMRSAVITTCFILSALSGALGCESTPVDDDNTSAGTGGVAGSSSGGGSMSPPTSMCSAALRQSVGLLDEVSTGVVTQLETTPELVLYVDASAGGDTGGDEAPWVYISLAGGSAVALTDLEALESTAWDLALKRFIIRTNSGDSGPGQGGALRVALPWDSVDASTQGNRALPVEQWFDDECNLVTGSTNELVTTFSGWYQYNTATHRLDAIEGVYLTQAADGAKYKVAVLDYYSNPDGSHGRVDGHFKLRIAPLR